jgi:predicted dehydrogenase
MKITAAVIGYGYWGPNLARNISYSEKYILKAVCDLSDDALARARDSLGENVLLTNSLETILQDPTIDLIAISTPPASHFSLAYKSIDAGKHVLVEKPFCTSSTDCLTLVSLAEKKGRFIFVDHTYLFHPDINYVKALIDSGDIGDLIYYDSCRINLGLFQTDTSALWDLAIHDLSILLFLFNQKPDFVSCTSNTIKGHDQDCTFYLNLKFPDKSAHINVSWLSPVKIRRTILGGSKKFIVFNDLENDEKIKIYNKGINLSPSAKAAGQVLVSYRQGDVCSPYIPRTEALANEMNHIANCILDKTKPRISTGEDSMMLIQILEACEKSSLLRGAPVEIEL